MSQVSLRQSLRQLALRFPPRIARRVEDFLPAPCNQRALEMVLDWPAWPDFACLLVGPHGSGRTHLAHIWCARADARYLPGADCARITDPLDWLHGVQALAIDDAERADPRRLLEFYNLLRERSGSLLLVAAGPPAGFAAGLPDLSSRLAAIPLVELGPPDETLLEALIVKQCRDRDLMLEPAIVSFLARRTERSYAAVCRLVDALDRLSLSAQRRVTRAVARAALEICAGDESAPP